MPGHEYLSMIVVRSRSLNFLEMYYRLSELSVATKPHSPFYVHGSFPTTARGHNRLLNLAKRIKSYFTLCNSAYMFFQYWFK